jgi:hypothetical protein
MPIPALRASEHLHEVKYEIRGALARRAEQLEREGHEVIKRNIGNPGAFGFRMPDSIRVAVVENLHQADPYSHQKGVFPAREAVVMQAQDRGVMDVTADDVFIGNGVSELIMLAMRALLNPDDEVLVPSPDYPLWAASVVIHGVQTVHYPGRPLGACDRCGICLRCVPVAGRSHGRPVVASAKRGGPDARVERVGADRSQYADLRGGYGRRRRGAGVSGGTLRRPQPACADGCPGRVPGPALPPSLGALGVVQTATAVPPWWDWLTRSRLTVCVELGLRFFLIAAVIALRSWGGPPSTWTQAAALHGVPTAKHLARVVVPHAVPALAAAILLIGLLATADVGSVLLLHPPGQGSLPLAIFTVMANAPESLVAALCLTYVALAFGIVSLFCLSTGGDRS